MHNDSLYFYNIIITIYYHIGLQTMLFWDNKLILYISPGWMCVPCPVVLQRVEAPLRPCWWWAGCAVCARSCAAPGCAPHRSPAARGGGAGGGGGHQVSSARLPLSQPANNTMSHVSHLVAVHMSFIGIVVGFRDGAIPGVYRGL